MVPWLFWPSSLLSCMLYPRGPRPRYRVGLWRISVYSALNAALHFRSSSSCGSRVSWLRVLFTFLRRHLILAAVMSSFHQYAGIYQLSDPLDCHRFSCSLSNLRFVPYHTEDGFIKLLFPPSPLLRRTWWSRCVYTSLRDHFVRRPISLWAKLRSMITLPLPISYVHTTGLLSSSRSSGARLFSKIFSFLWAAGVFRLLFRLLPLSSAQTRFA